LNKAELALAGGGMAIDILGGLFGVEDAGAQEVGESRRLPRMRP